MPEFRQVEKFDDVEVEHETDEAILVEIAGEDVWIPKSQIDDTSEVYDEDEGRGPGKLIISHWIAVKKGLV